MQYQDIKKPRGYKPPVAKKKPALYITLADGRKVPTFALMVALLNHSVNKA